MRKVAFAPTTLLFFHFVAPMEFIVKKELDVVTSNQGQTWIGISSEDVSEDSSPNTSNMLQNDESEDDLFIESLKKDLQREVKRPKVGCLMDDDAFVSKKPKLEEAEVVVPPGFLAPLSREPRGPDFQQDLSRAVVNQSDKVQVRPSARQFWKAGDYEIDNNVNSSSFRGGLCNFLFAIFSLL